MGPEKATGKYSTISQYFSIRHEEKYQPTGSFLTATLAKYQLSGCPVTESAHAVVVVLVPTLHSRDCSKELF